MSSPESRPLVFRIHGMDCADEAGIPRKELGPMVQSAEQLSFDILRGKADTSRRNRGHVGEFARDTAINANRSAIAPRLSSY